MTADTKNKLPVRIGLALATLVYLGYSMFGIRAPFWWGHHGYHGAQYLLRARMSLRLHTIYPITWSGFDPTYPQNALYFHHPIALHHLLTLTVPIFGDHEWLARSVGVVGGLVAMWSLYRLVARFWSREAGLIAVVVWVALPFVCSFSVLCDAMFWEFAAVCWMLNAYLSLYDDPSRRNLIIAFVAALVGGLFMWEVYFVAPGLALHAATRRFAREGRALTVSLGKRRWNALTLHTIASALGCALALGFHLFLTWKAGAIGETVESYDVRKNAQPGWVLDRHNQWIELLYGKPPVAVAALWMTWFLARCALGRARRRDLATLTFLLVNLLYYYLFPEGSAVHLYRVFFYAGFFLLAAADLAIAVGHAARRVVGRAWVQPLATAAVVLAYLVAEVPHAWANLLESREVMGTHGEARYNPEREKTLFAQEVHQRTTQADRVIIDYRHLGARKEFWYYIDRSFDELSWLAELKRYDKTLPRSVLMLDFQQLDPSEQKIFAELVAQHPVTFFNRFTMIDLRSSQPGITSYRFVDGKMTPSYRFWVSHKYPPLGLEPEVYLPGVCAALDAGAPPPALLVLPAAAASPSQQLCWHNLLVAAGQPAQAGPLVERVVAGLPAVGQYLGGVRVVAAGVTNDVLRVAYLSEKPQAGELRYRFTDGAGKVTSLRRAQVPPLARWQGGFLYVDQVTLPRAGGSVEAELAAGTPPTVGAHAALATVPAPPAPPKPAAPAPSKLPLPAKPPVPAKAPLEVTPRR